MTLGYSVVWVRAIRWEPSAFVGIGSYAFHVHDNALEIERVTPEGPAARAGLRDGDRIVAVDGRPFTHMSILYDGISKLPPETTINVTVERTGSPAPLDLPVGLEAWPQTERSTAHRIADELIDSYPRFFFVVGFGVLFLRLGDRHAWLLALFFTSVVVSGPLVESLGGVPPALRGAALAYRFIIGPISGALFYFFLAVFPVRSPLDRCVPWLKWALLAFQLPIGLALAVPVLLAGDSRPMYVAYELIDNRLPWLGPITTALGFGAYALGLVSLVPNTVRAPTAEVRRRTRVILWGLALGPVSFLAVQAIAIARGVPFYLLSYWIWARAYCAFC